MTVGQVVDLRCPGCGSAVSTGDCMCKYCGREVLISTFNSVYSMPMPEVNKCVSAYRQGLQADPENQEINFSIAACYLKLKLYDKALEAFEKAIEGNFDNSEAFFYASVCLLRGKKAFLTPRADIDKAQEYINAALSIEPKGIYYYFFAYIKYDYFSRKCLITEPNYTQAIQQAQMVGVSVYDIEQLFAVLGVARPDCL